MPLCMPSLCLLPSILPWRCNHYAQNEHRLGFETAF